MARRTHGTRQKLVFRVAAAKPRNPLVAPAIKRAAGPHRKGPSALRGAQKSALRKTLAPDAGSDDDT